MLNDVVSKQIPYFLNSGITLNTYIEPDLPLIDASPEYLEQVFLHILNNANDFTSSGGQVDIYAFDEEDNLHKIISDTGLELMIIQLRTSL
ncbi:MAG: sensor histidine kinase [Methanohalobium sp.]|uniref:sensor histidine kinase n=1 Tax=Methanohalobium sp. TaxID=2837493 RepID=UPI00397A5F65